MSDEKMLAKLETLDSSTFRPEFQQVCWLILQVHSSMRKAAAHKAMFVLSMLPADVLLIRLLNCLSGSASGRHAPLHQLSQSSSDWAGLPCLLAHSMQLSVHGHVSTMSPGTSDSSKQHLYRRPVPSHASHILQPSPMPHLTTNSKEVQLCLTLTIMHAGSLRQ